MKLVFQKQSDINTSQLCIQAFIAQTERHHSLIMSVQTIPVESLDFVKLDRLIKTV